MVTVLTSCTTLYFAGFLHGNSATVMYNSIFWRLFLHGNSANVMYSSILWRLFWRLSPFSLGFGTNTAASCSWCKFINEH